MGLEKWCLNTCIFFFYLFQYIFFLILICFVEAAIGLGTFYCYYTFPESTTLRAHLRGQWNEKYAYPRNEDFTNAFNHAQYSVRFPKSTTANQLMLVVAESWFFFRNLYVFCNLTFTDEVLWNWVRRGLHEHYLQSQLQSVLRKCKSISKSVSRRKSKSRLWSGNSKRKESQYYLPLDLLCTFQKRKYSDSKYLSCQLAI